MAEFIEERKNKDKSVTYRVKIPYYANGKRKFFSESFSSKKYGSKKMALEMAKDCRDKMKIHLMTNNIISVELFAISELLNESFELLPVTMQTIRKQKILCKRYITDVIGDLNIDKVKVSDIQKTLNMMIKSCSSDTINRVYSICKRLYKTAIMKDAVYNDLSAKVTPPKSELIKPRREMRLDNEVFNKTLESLLSGDNDYRLVGNALLIMYYTGMRPSEVYALTKNDIDIQNRTITINKAIGSNITDFNIVRKTKNEQSIRTIPYTEDLDIVFEELLKTDKEFLFVKKNKKIINGNWASDLIRRVSDGKFRSYQLRHNFSTELIKSKADVRTIQEMMGHADSQMTIDYARSDLETMRKTLKNIKK
jgi:integrase